MLFEPSLCFLNQGQHANLYWTGFLCTKKGLAPFYRRGFFFYWPQKCLWTFAGEHSGVMHKATIIGYCGWSPYKCFTFISKQQPPSERTNLCSVKLWQLWNIPIIQTGARCVFLSFGVSNNVSVRRNSYHNFEFPKGKLKYNNLGITYETSGLKQETEPLIMQCDIPFAVTNKAAWLIIFTSNFISCLSFLAFLHIYRNCSTPSSLHFSLKLHQQ